MRYINEVYNGYLSCSPGTDGGLGELEHLPRLLVGAALLQALALQVPSLQLLEPARVGPPQPAQEPMGPRAATQYWNNTISTAHRTHTQSVQHTERTPSVQHSLNAHNQYSTH